MANLTVYVVRVCPSLCPPIMSLFAISPFVGHKHQAHVQAARHATKVARRYAVTFPGLGMSCYLNHCALHLYEPYATTLRILQALEP
jgi:hypothetical protein